MAVGVRVRDLDSSEGLPSNHTRTFGRRPVDRLEQFVVFVAISVRPTIHRDRLNVASGIEAARCEYAAKLISYLTLEGFEFCADELPPSCPVLVLAIQAGFAWSAKKVKQAGLIRRTGKVVVAHGDGEIQCNVAEVRSRSVDRANTEFLKCFPVADLHIGVNKRHLHTVAARGRTTQESRAVIPCTARGRWFPPRASSGRAQRDLRNGLPQAEQKAQELRKHSCSTVVPLPRRARSQQFPQN